MSGGECPGGKVLSPDLAYIGMEKEKLDLLWLV